MIIKQHSENIHQAMGISDQRANEIREFITPYINESEKKGLFDGARILKELEQSGRISSIEEFCLVFFIVGSYLGAKFEQERELQRKMKAAESLMNAIEATELIGKGQAPANEKDKPVN